MNDCNDINSIQFTSSFDALLSKMEIDLPKEQDNILKTIEHFDMIDQTIIDLYRSNIDRIVKLNIGGQIFMTKLTNLLWMKDTLFYKLFYHDPLIITNEIFFDRIPKYFSYILDYLRDKRMIDFDMFSFEELKEFKVEAEYYEIYDLIDYFNSRPYEIKIINAYYKLSQTPLIDNKLEDICNRDDLTTGLYVAYPGQLTIKLNYNWCIDKILFAFLINPRYSSYNNNIVQIDISEDNQKWKKFSIIPSYIKNDIIIIKGNSNIKGRLIRFTPNNNLGIGYLKIIPF